MSFQKNILWFRQDLRLSDNPALVEAAKEAHVIPLYIIDDSDEGQKQKGAASNWWLSQSLKSLRDSGVPLLIQKGKPLEVLRKLKKQLCVDGIYWNRTYTPYDIKRDRDIKATIEGCRTFNASLLYEPWTISNLKGDYYRVFTPFWKKCLTHQTREVLPVPFVVYAKGIENEVENLPLESCLLKEPWQEKLHQYWKPGEKNAHENLKVFLKQKLEGYKEKRDLSYLDNTSHLSPYLHFGEISPHQILKAIQDVKIPDGIDFATFCSELGWREFSTYLLYHAPHMLKHPFQEKFKGLSWEDDVSKIDAWRHGKTGYPIVDAGMRELWETGYMHNRVRMIVASFLTKHCQIHWAVGEAHFRDTLVDADIASNVFNWQWVAGCGADAAPYFRIFNPVTQSKKFDPDGLYIRRWVPELSNLSAKQIHTPWTLSSLEQDALSCRLGINYPLPILDLDEKRKEALEKYKAL